MKLFFIAYGKAGVSKKNKVDQNEEQPRTSEETYLETRTEEKSSAWAGTDLF